MQCPSTASYTTPALLTSHLSAASVGGRSFSSSRNGFRACARTSCDAVSFVKTSHTPSLTLRGKSWQWLRHQLLCIALLKQGFTVRPRLGVWGQ